MIENVRIYLSALWIALMLTYLLGDVMRIFVGDFTPGEIQGTPITQPMALGIAVFMLIPIVMLFLSLTLDYSLNRWLNIILAILLLGFNLIGLPSYPGAYDKFLIIVGLGINALTIYYAWTWV